MGSCSCLSDVALGITADVTDRSGEEARTSEEKALDQSGDVYRLNSISVIEHCNHFLPWHFDA